MPQKRRSTTSATAKGKPKAPKEAVIKPIFNFNAVKTTLLAYQEMTNRMLTQTIAGMSHAELGNLHKQLDGVIDHATKDPLLLHEHQDDIAWLKSLRVAVKNHRTKAKLELSTAA